MTSTAFTVVPIGYVRRETAERGPEESRDRAPSVGASIERLRAERVSLDLDPRYREGLLGLEVGADILVLCYLDRASRDVLQVHPRGDMARPLRGVFATRSPGRPNPISVTSARVLHIEGTTIDVVGLDVLDGSPILDIKPHAAAFDTPYRG